MITAVVKGFSTDEDDDNDKNNPERYNDDDDDDDDDDDNNKPMSHNPQACFIICKSPFQISVWTSAEEKVIVNGNVKIR